MDYFSNTLTNTEILSVHANIAKGKPIRLIETREYDIPVVFAIFECEGHSTTFQFSSFEEAKDWIKSIGVKKPLVEIYPKLARENL